MGEDAVGDELTELVGVDEIAGAVLIAEEQPVLARGSSRHPLMQEGAERRDAGTGPDHDDLGVIGGQPERLVGGDVHAHLLADRSPIGEVGRTHAASIAVPVR